MGVGQRRDRQRHQAFESYTRAEDLTDVTGMNRKDDYGGEGSLADETRARLAACQEHG